MLTPKEIADMTGLSYRSVLRPIEDGEHVRYGCEVGCASSEPTSMRGLEANVVEPPRSAGVEDRFSGPRRATGKLRAAHKHALSMDMDDRKRGGG